MLHSCLTRVTVSPLQKSLNSSSEITAGLCSVSLFEGWHRGEEIYIFQKPYHGILMHSQVWNSQGKGPNQNHVGKRGLITLDETLILVGMWPKWYPVFLRTVENFWSIGLSQCSASTEGSLESGSWPSSLCNPLPSSRPLCSTHIKLFITCYGYYAILSLYMFTDALLWIRDVFLLYLENSYSFFKLC